MVGTFVSKHLILTKPSYGMKKIPKEKMWIAQALGAITLIMVVAAILAFVSPPQDPLIQINRDTLEQEMDTIRHQIHTGWRPVQNDTR